MELAKGEKERKYFHELKGKLKKKLPAWVFSAGEITKSEKIICGKPCMAAWRKSEFVKLNGLCMLDIDNIKPLSDSPEGESQPARACFERIVEKWNREASPRGGLEGVASFCKHYGILFAHITPSGRGLRLVFKADPERGNLADNQQWLANELGVRLDEACKDATRLSYGCSRKDILYIELENLLNYDDKGIFDKKYGEAYRKGNTTPLQLPRGGESDGAEQKASPRGGLEGVLGTLEGAPVVEATPRTLFIFDACLKELGLTSDVLVNVGRRHDTVKCILSKGAVQLLSKAEMLGVLKVRMPENWQDKNILTLVDDFYRRYHNATDKMTEFQQRVFAQSVKAPLSSPVKGKKNTSESLPQGGGQGEAPLWDFEKWAVTFSSWFESKVWKPVCSVMPRYSRLNGMLAAGTMFGTLLSGCRLRNWYDGSDLALTFMTYIIGDAGTGKGDYREIDRLIMEPLRQADARGRKAEESYQKEMKRLSMAKAKKDDVPEEKHFPVRYLPTDTTLKQKLERCRYSLHQFGAEQRQVACWNFESELSSKVAYEKQSWNSSQDFDKKSFDCEMTGAESRSTMTTNGLVPAFYNFLVTGTPDALLKKINARNCLDGLPTRLLMGVQYGQKYKMLGRDSRRRNDADSDWLRTVGIRLMECGWDVNLEQPVKVPKKWQDRLGKQTSFTDALYYWGQQKAFACQLEDFELGDYFRKRPPMIAARLAVVDAIMNSLDSFEKDGTLNLSFSSIELALHLADYIFDAQIWYFGKQIEDALEGTVNTGNVRHNTKRIIAFGELPDTFTTEDVGLLLNVSQKTAWNILTQWQSNNYVKRIKRGTYIKLVKILV